MKREWSSARRSSATDLVVLGGLCYVSHPPACRTRRPRSHPHMSRRTVWIRGLLISAFVLLTCQQIWRHGHDYVFADKFLVVEPGKLYRGAWQQTWPMKGIIRDFHIKTIVALAHPDSNPLSIRERQLATDMGVRWLHIPIVEESTSQGERKTVADALERAADALADPQNQPVYFHCHHGVNRASMVQMAYRMLHCGWTHDRALNEIAQSPFGLVPVQHGVDYRYMTTFYNERVVPRRQAQQPAVAAMSTSSSH
jgi:protein-tyrosine phosphatase